METYKASELKPDLRRVLVLGVPFSGKTTFLATAPRPILVFASDATTEARLAGQEDIEIVRCYDQQGELEGSGVRRFDAAWKEVMCMKTMKWKSVGVDTFNYLFDDKLQGYKGTTVSQQGKKDGLAAYGRAKDYGVKFLKQVTMLPCYVIVLAHVRLNDDDTTGRTMYLPAVEGSTKDSMPGRFDAAFYTETVGIGPAAKHVIKFHPDMQHLCGVKVPIGKEGLLKKELPFNLQEIIQLLRS